LFVTYPVRSSKVLRILMSTMAVCLKAFAFDLRLWPWLHHC